MFSLLNSGDILINLLSVLKRMRKEVDVHGNEVGQMFGYPLYENLQVSKNCSFIILMCQSKERVYLFSPQTYMHEQTYANM